MNSYSSQLVLKSARSHFGQFGLIDLVNSYSFGQFILTVRSIRTILLNSSSFWSTRTQFVLILEPLMAIHLYAFPHDTYISPPTKSEDMNDPPIRASVRLGEHLAILDKIMTLIPFRIQWWSVYPINLRLRSERKKGKNINKIKGHYFFV